MGVQKFSHFLHEKYGDGPAREHLRAGTRVLIDGSGLLHHLLRALPARARELGGDYAALDAAYDASVNRLEASYVQAVASRRTQQASVPQPQPASTAVPPVVPSWVRNAAAVGSSCCSTSSEAPSVARMSFSASDHEAQASKLFGRMKYSSPPAL